MTKIRNLVHLLPMRRKLRRNQTDTERTLWGRLRNKQFHNLKFYRQYSLGNYILDFYCPVLKLGIELDGGQHAETEHVEKDAARTQYLNQEGVKVIRFWDNEVLTNVEGVFMVLERTLNNSPQPPLFAKRGSSTLAIVQQDLKDFLTTAQKPLVVILGPTGSGKTDLSLDLAQKFNGEIVNADSRQIYEGMDIGTNKIAPDEMRGISHHLLSFKNPDEVFTVAEYKEKAVNVIRDILQRNKIPFLVGGTGLYINAVCFNYHIPAIAPDYELREKLEKELVAKGSSFMHEKLMQLDPEAAQKIHPNQKRYLVRALEIALSGQKKSLTASKGKPLFDCFFIGLDIPRTELYQRLDRRVEAMFKKGLLEEVQHLLQKGYDEHAHAMNGIGYKEVLQYLHGATSLDQAKQAIQQHTRNFAKRQMTWFRRIENIHWIGKL